MKIIVSALVAAAVTLGYGQVPTEARPKSSSPGMTLTLSPSDPFTIADSEGFSLGLTYRDVDTWEGNFNYPGGPDNWLDEEVYNSDMGFETSFDTAIFTVSSGFRTSLPDFYFSSSLYATAKPQTATVVTVVYVTLKDTSTALKDSDLQKSITVTVTH